MFAAPTSIISVFQQIKKLGVTEERLKENGISIDDGPAKRWGAHVSGVSVYFRDPDENVTEVRYYDSKEADRPCMLNS